MSPSNLFLRRVSPSNLFLRRVSPSSLFLRRVPRPPLSLFLRRVAVAFVKNSIGHRGAILWNAVSSYNTGSQFSVFYRKVKNDNYIKELNFSAQSVQSLPRHYNDFKCY